MDNKLYVPGRLKSAVVGGHVTGTEDIIDDELQLTQAQINAIVLSGNVTVSLTVTPNVAFIGQQTPISVKGTCSTRSNITLKKGSAATGTVIGEVTHTTLTVSDNLTPVSGVSDNNMYSGVFVIGGMQKTASAKVTGVDHIYYGALASYDASNLYEYGTATTTTTRTYNMNIDSTPRKIYFKYPRANVTGITKVELLSNGNYSPVLGSIDNSLSDSTYYVWVSNDTYNDATAGNRSFVVNRN